MRSRRCSPGSTTTIRSAPAARSASAVITPIGPAPSTQTDSPVPTSASVAAWTPTASGSTSAPCSSLTESGSANRLSAETTTRSA